MTVATEQRLLEVKGLKKFFPIRSGLLRRVTGQVRAVDDVLRGQLRAARRLLAQRLRAGAQPRLREPRARRRALALLVVDPHVARVVARRLRRSPAARDVGARHALTRAPFPRAPQVGRRN